MGAGAAGRSQGCCPQKAPGLGTGPYSRGKVQRTLLVGARGRGVGAEGRGRGGRRTWRRDGGRGAGGWGGGKRAREGERRAGGQGAGAEAEEGSRDGGRMVGGWGMGAGAEGRGAGTRGRGSGARTRGTGWREAGWAGGLQAQSIKGQEGQGPWGGQGWVWRSQYCDLISCGLQSSRPRRRRHRERCFSVPVQG